jgi:hypothetical protein
MIGIVVFNVAIIALGVLVGAGLLPVARVSGALDWLHAIIGITPPTMDKARFFALVWIGSLLVIVDGLLLLLVFLTSHLM